MPETITINIRDLKFDCLTTGDPKNDLIIFLHGFPESAHMWIKLMEQIAALGFFCVAPNQRGYSKDACPVGKKQYTLDKLAGDVIDISQFFDRSKFHLVGHDWGAVIGWKVVHDHKDCILSWTALSVPHIQAFGHAMMNDPEQRRMSQYVKDFQWPYFPEKRLRKNDFYFFRKLWKSSAPEQVDAYLDIFRNNKQLTAAINYYRANYKLLKKAVSRPILGDIQVPTLFIWGNKDLAIGAKAVSGGHQYIKGDYEFLELDEGHWLIQKQYETISNAISNHIQKYQSQS